MRAARTTTMSRRTPCMPTTGPATMPAGIALWSAQPHTRRRIAAVTPRRRTPFGFPSQPRIRSRFPLGPAILPVHLMSALSASGSIILDWEDPATDASSVTGYQILRRSVRDTGNLEVYMHDTGTTATTYEDSDVVRRSLVERTIELCHTDGAVRGKLNHRSPPPLHRHNQVQKKKSCVPCSSVSIRILQPM